MTSHPKSILILHLKESKFLEENVILTIMIVKIDTIGLQKSSVHHVKYLSIELHNMEIGKILISYYFWTYRALTCYYLI